jgi:hypothetical protein
MKPFSVLAVPVAVGTNLSARRRIGKLASPSGSAEGKLPLPVGRSMWLRWQTLGVLVPFVILTLIISGIVHAVQSRDKRATSVVGQCVLVSTDPQSVFADVSIVSCDSTHNGVVAQMVEHANDCPTGTMEAALGGYDYCIVRQ